LSTRTADEKGAPLRVVDAHRRRKGCATALVARHLQILDFRTLLAADRWLASSDEGADDGEH
jgi:hypothetical protein